MNNPTLQIKEITKTFPGVLALNKINIEAFSGEVLGLIGINGAGKSTLMNILAGVTHADSGHIMIDGKVVDINTPKKAEKSGIAFIHQEAVLFSTMSIAENMFISNLKTNKTNTFLDIKKMEDESKRYLKMLGSELDPKTLISDLPIGDRQIVEIARALSKGSKLILFDEPTSSLSFKEKERLFGIMRSLKENGATIIFISHFLDEIALICDRIAVLRDGTVSGSGLINQFHVDDIVKLMLGITINQYIPRKDKAIGEVVLEVNNLSGNKAPKDASFELKKGEILGLWGLLGSGRTELVRTLLGLDSVQKGNIFYRDNGTMKPISGKKLLQISGFVTENRHEDGLFLSTSLWENISAASLMRFTSKLLKLLDKNNEQTVAGEMIKKLNIAAPNVHIKVKQLSGGNQQKVIMGKWLHKQPKIYFLDEPTRGVDVGAKAEIHKIISELTENGSSVILISSEIDEIVSLSDRVIIMRRGSIVCDVPKDEINKDNLMSKCVGEVN